MPTMADFTNENQNLCCILQDQPIFDALATMVTEGYSQLPVLKNGKKDEAPIRKNDIVGVISLESIGKFLLSPDFKEDALVGKCLDSNNPPMFCKETDPIKDVAERMAGEYVLVLGNDKSLRRLVTHYDLSKLYLNLAKPFSLIETIELSLREKLNKLSPDALKEAASEEKRKGQIYAAEDLEFSEYITLFSRHWEELRMPKITKKRFIKYLDDTRCIRNKIMHFRPEGITDNDRRRLEGLRKLLSL